MTTTFQKVVELMIQGGSYTTLELSQRFDVSVKTIQNYMKKLMDTSGVVKNKTRYSYPQEFRNIEIHQKVQMSTALMISLYKKAIPELEESVAYNFQSLPKESNAFLFDIEFESIKNQILFNQIVTSIIQENALEFQYINRQNIASTKSIFPLKVANFKSYWYLIGYDFKSEKIKTFYIKSISSLMVLEESFLNEKEKKSLILKVSTITSPWFLDQKKSVVLKITGEAIPYFQENKDNTLEIIKREDNFLLIKMDYYNDIEILSLIQKWLLFIKIIDNDPLQEKLKVILQTALEKLQ